MKRTGYKLLAAAGVVWLVTHMLVQDCANQLNPFTGPGVCTGMPAVAYHLQGWSTLVVGCLAIVGTLYALGGSSRT